MKVNIVPIGNSKGVRIPSTVLRQCNLYEQVELEVQNNKIILKPLKHKAREGWDDAFRLMHEQKDDALLFDESVDSDMKDWEWK